MVLVVVVVVRNMPRLRRRVSQVAVGVHMTDIGRMVVFFVWAGQSALGSISLPSWWVVAIGVAVVAACIAAAFAITPTRKVLVEKGVPVIGRA